MELSLLHFDPLRLVDGIDKGNYGKGICMEKPKSLLFQEKALLPPQLRPQFQGIGLGNTSPLFDAM